MFYTNPRFQIHKHIDPNCLTFKEFGFWQCVIGGQNSLIFFSLLPIDSPTLCLQGMMLEWEC